MQVVALGLVPFTMGRGPGVAQFCCHFPLESSGSSPTDDFVRTDSYMSHMPVVNIRFVYNNVTLMQIKVHQKEEFKNYEKGSGWLLLLV